MKLIAVHLHDTPKPANLKTSAFDHSREISGPENRSEHLRSRESVSAAQTACCAGARGYLLKDARRGEVLDAIRRVHAGDTLLPPQLTAKLAQRVTDESLTDREREVPGLVAEGRSNREIGSQIHIEESTVKTHLKSIFAKLHAGEPHRSGHCRDAARLPAPLARIAIEAAARA